MTAAEWLFFIVINQIITLALSKFVFGMPKNASDKKKENVTWHSAIDTMAAMESRIEQLVSRDAKNQEQVWKLQDLNRDLHNRTMRLTKELLEKRQFEDEGNISEEDDDNDTR